MPSLYSLLHAAYKKLIKGRSRYKAARRYEIVLNVLFVSSLFACLSSAVYETVTHNFMASDTLLRIAVYTTVLIILWWLSRTGRHTLTAFAFFVCSFFALANTMLTPRFGLPLFEVAAALCLLIIGMLLEVRLTRAALAAERDQLELRVIERTKQLEETQLRRTLELHRFAEFGRLNAQLLHEVSNPLTVASLYLEQADHRSSSAIRQARRSLVQLERYVESARKQLQLESEPKHFAVRHEIRQLFRVLKPMAQKAQVHLKFEMTEETILYGDPVHFNHIIANLVSNAVDAYQDIPLTAQNRNIFVYLKRSSRYLHIEVQDFGTGICPEALPQIFEPFFTTKSADARGLGIGLAIVKQTVKNEFNGTICANSMPGSGTKFTVFLQLEPTTSHTDISEVAIERKNLSLDQQLPLRQQLTD
ncbi:MAG: HAMP domain-containing sensor histidine kinase [Patescibacteria group bacterium]|nr:HAMP domain-containing sensor histidine kinase [Patescibacteria group bacterium]